MKPQTIEEIRKDSCSENEALSSIALYELLKPYLKVKKDNGRFETSSGSKTILGLYRTIKQVVENEERICSPIIESDFIRIKNDSNGNPRYVIHFLQCCPKKWTENSSIVDKYERAIKLMRKIGGGRFHNKQYGGGIVFQSYTLRETISAILTKIKEVDNETKN